MSKLKQALDAITNESSTNKKMDILRSFKDVPLLKEVLYGAYSRRVKYYIRVIPPYTTSRPTLKLEQALEVLKKFSSRDVTGRAATNLLQDTLCSLSEDDAKIIEFMIDKSCSLGMGSTNINKVFPKLIEKTPYMGAQPYNVEKIKTLLRKGACYSQVKMDGRYCNAIVRSAQVDLESRQGETTALKGALFIDELRHIDDCVLNGELTIPGISRYESNGIIASLVSIGKKQLEGEDVTDEIEKFTKKHGDYEKALDSIVFTVWDAITIDEYFQKSSDTPYHKRLTNARILIEDLVRVKPIECVKINSLDEAIEHFQSLLAEGMEGTIIKSEAGEWVDGKPSWQIKLKLEMDIDLEVTGFNYGTGKNEDVISSLVAESSDKLLLTMPTGITEEMMAYITKNQKKLLGTIVTVKCSGLSFDRKGNYSVLHPVFKEFRTDKVKADSLVQIKKIENAIKEL